MTKATLGREVIESVAMRVEQCCLTDISKRPSGGANFRLIFLNKMSDDKSNTDPGSSTFQPTYEGVEIVELSPSTALRDYRDAMNLSSRVADDKLGTHMLLSWYDRDRDFESPQHSSESHSDSNMPGYVDYGLYNGATLKVDVENGRFVFFYLSTDS